MAGDDDRTLDDFDDELEWLSNSSKHTANSSARRSIERRLEEKLLRRNLHDELRDTSGELEELDW